MLAGKWSQPAVFRQAQRLTFILDVIAVSCGSLRLVVILSRLVHLLAGVKIDGEVDELAVLGDQLLQLGLVQVLLRLLLRPGRAGSAQLQ